MRVLGYMTTDPVNANTAQALAARHGLDLQVVEPRDLPRLKGERMDLVIDWDFIPEDCRAILRKNTAVNIVAIHGYDLDDSLALFLPLRGILFSPRLDQQLMKALTGMGDAA